MFWRLCLVWCCRGSGCLRAWTFPSSTSEVPSILQKLRIGILGFMWPRAEPWDTLSLARWPFGSPAKMPSKSHNHASTKRLNHSSSAAKRIMRGVPSRKKSKNPGDTPSRLSLRQPAGLTQKRISFQRSSNFGKIRTSDYRVCRVMF